MLQRPCGSCSLHSREQAAGRVCVCCRRTLERRWGSASDGHTAAASSMMVSVMLHAWQLTNLHTHLPLTATVVAVAACVLHPRNPHQAC